jgi:hypothetical protein
MSLSLSTLGAEQGTMSKAGLRRHELGVGLRTFSAGSAADHGNFGFARARAAAKVAIAAAHARWGDDKNRGANVNIVRGTARKGRGCRGADE